MSADLDGLFADLIKFGLIEAMRDPAVVQAWAAALKAAHVPPGVAPTDSQFVRGVKGAAAFIGFSPKFVENARSTGSFCPAASEVGGRLLFRKTDLLAWLASSPKIVVRPRKRKQTAAPGNGKVQSKAASA